MRSPGRRDIARKEPQKRRMASSTENAGFTRQAPRQSRPGAFVCVACSVSRHGCIGSGRAGGLQNSHSLPCPQLDITGFRGLSRNVPQPEVSNAMPRNAQRRLERIEAARPARRLKVIIAFADENGWPCVKGVPVDYDAYGPDVELRVFNIVEYNGDREQR